MQCVVLAGGLATRMRPFTDKIPKSLLPVGKAPFIHHQLSWLSRHGVERVLLCVGYKGEMIRDYVGNGSAWGVDVQYVDEGENLRGTAGALRLALEASCLEDRFLLTYGDSYLPIDFASVWEAFRSGEKPALMTVFRNEGKWDRSNAHFDGGKVTLYDKNAEDPRARGMDFIDYGLSGLERKIVEEWVPPRVHSDLALLFHRLSVAGLLAGFEIKTRFYEIGSVSGLKDFEAYVLSPENDARPETEPRGNPLDLSSLF